MKRFVRGAFIRRLRDESAQGLVEYALIMALITFSASAGMGTVASGLNTAFSAIASIFGTYI